MSPSNYSVKDTPEHPAKKKYGKNIIRIKREIRKKVFLFLLGIQSGQLGREVGKGPLSALSEDQESLRGRLCKL